MIGERHATAAAKPYEIVRFETSPFPYDGAIPGSGGKPFLDTMLNGMRAHTSPRGGVYPQSPTYSNQNVLLALTPRFDSQQAVLVVFLHGNLAELERDVVRRQRVVAQVLASGLHAALVVPQFAVDALDSSAGHFWDADGFARFLQEAAEKLADYGRQPADAFRRMPVVIVAYSGGYNPAAAILGNAVSANSEVDARIAGVILLDAIYAEEATFAEWIARSNRTSFFFSAYSVSSVSGTLAVEAEIGRRGITVTQGLPASLGPGITAFCAAGAVPHNEFVTRAWAADPLRLALSRIRL